MSLQEEDSYLACSNITNQSKPFVSDLIHFSVGTVAIVSCLLVIITLFCYKLHCFFNYRLLIYWLIAHILMSFAHVVALPVAWYGPGMVHLCQSIAALDTYSLWVLLVSSLFIAVEMISMAVYNVQLKFLEIPIVLTSLLLPLTFFWVPLETKNYGYTSPYGCWIRDQDEHCNKSQAGHTERLAIWYIPLLVLFVLIYMAFAIVTLTLAVRSCKEKMLYSSDERESLLSSRSTYYTALKEIAILFGCSVIALVLITIVGVVVVFHGPSESILWLKVLFSTTPDIFSLMTAVSLAVHLFILGKKKRPVSGKSGCCWTRKRSLHLVTSCVDEGAEYAVASSITVTHPTEFEPPTESEVESQEYAYFQH